MQPEPFPQLPAGLLQAVASRMGQVALVMGAGCSLEPPTSLKLSRDYSVDVHRKLVADGVIQDGACDDPEDLSVLAESVFDTTRSQSAVVKRLPRRKFQTARANSGHLDAVAMVIEGAIDCILTLNYDLALNDAITILGGEAIRVIDGPENLDELGPKTVIYLHGNANERIDDRWILRKSALEKAWQQTWQELLASRVSTMPHLVFVGLGSPAPILTESVSRVGRMTNGSHTVYLVDPGEDSQFVVSLSLSKGDIIPLTWCEFMDRLAKRVARECCDAMKSSALALCRDRNWTIDKVQLDRLIEGFLVAGLRPLGRARAAWLCKTVPYSRDSEDTLEPMVQLLVALSKMLTEKVHQVSVTGDGLVEVRAGGGMRGYAMGIHGSGIKPRSWVYDAIAESTIELTVKPDVVVVAGFTGLSSDEVAAPDDIVHGYERADHVDIVLGQPRPILVEFVDVFDKDLLLLDLVA